MKKYFDAIILFVNTLLVLMIGVPAIWLLAFNLKEHTLDILNAGVLILLPALMNVMCILILIGRKRSALFPLFNFLYQGFLWFFLIFINLLFSLLLGVNIIAIIFLIKKRPLIPRFKRKNGLIIIFLIILLLISPVLAFYGTAGVTITVPARENPNFRVSFYCEYYTNDTITNAHLNALEAYNSRIFLAINESQVFNNSLVHNLTRRLNNANVSVYAWLLVDRAKGYWAADSNVLEFEELVNNFTSWAEKTGLNYDGIMIDSEPDYQRLTTLMRQVSDLNIFGALGDLRKTATSGTHQFAKERYEALVSNIQQKGYEAMVVGFPMPIDDLADEDDTLQRLMGVSTMPPQNWNYSSFMIYRTTYQGTLGFEFGSYMVYSYAKSIWNYFGKKSSVSLARSGSSPYDSLEELKKDAFIVKNIGFDEVIWISFERFDRAFGVAGLVEFLDALEQTQSISFNYNPFCGYSRLLFVAIDKMEII